MPHQGPRADRAVLREHGEIPALGSLPCHDAGPGAAGAGGVRSGARPPRLDPGHVRPRPLPTTSRTCCCCTPWLWRSPLLTLGDVGWCSARLGWAASQRATDWNCPEYTWSGSWWWCCLPAVSPGLRISASAAPRPGQRPLILRAHGRQGTGNLVSVATRAAFTRIRRASLPRRTAEQALGAEVLVEVWPVDAVAGAGRSQRALGGGGVEQPGNQASGTEILRPSISATLSVSAPIGRRGRARRR